MVSNNPLEFNFYDYKPSIRIKASIEKAATFEKEIDAYQSRTSNELKAAIQKKLKLEWIYHSNAIEGSTLTLGDTIFFLEQGLTVNGKPFKDFLDAKNHAEAIDYLYDVVADKRDFTPYLMKEVNAMLLSGVSVTPAVDPQGKLTTKPLTPGAYKKQPNHVIQLDGTIHQYVEPIQVDAQMDALFDWVNANIDSETPIITAAVAHYNMVRIHPFDDGNGRGSRILMNLILMRKQYPSAIIKIEDRKLYIESLNKADRGEFEPFVELVSNSLIETQKLILSELKKFSSGTDPSSSSQ